jgi:Protein of unknown function (DUF2664).
MEKYHISYKGWFSMKEETGTDLVFFESTITSRNEEGFTFLVNIPYRMVEEHIMAVIPAGKSIVEQIHKRISGWGMQESLYCKELVECGIDVGSMVQEIVKSKIDLEAEEQRIKSLQTTSASGKIDLDDIEDSLAEMKEESNNYYAICEAIEKVVTNEVTELFPVLLESSPEVIRELEEIMSIHIPNFAEALNDLVSKAKNERG